MSATPPAQQPPAIRPGARVTQADLEAGLRRLGLQPGDTVLVHSSLSRFGHVVGGADAVIDALLAVLAPQGTLLMSAITTRWPMVNACIAAAEAGGLAAVAPFDVARQPTWAGTIAETFRQRAGVRRSWHPTHSVSGCGPLAAALLDNHHHAPGPCGEGTPYGRVTELERGFILLLGIGHNSNTTLHGLEELAGCEYVLYPKFARVPLLTPDGPAEAHTRVHLSHLGRRLGVLETAYLDGRAETVTHLGDAVCRLVHGPPMRSITLAALAADPWLLLTPDGVRAYHLMQEAGNWTRDPLAPREEP